MKIVCAGFGNHIDDAARRPPKFRARACSHHLKFLNGIQRNIYSRALVASLFTEEAVVVVTAVKADVIENATLSDEVDFISVRPLYDTHAGRQGQQVFKLSS